MKYDNASFSFTGIVLKCFNNVWKRKRVILLNHEFQGFLVKEIKINKLTSAS